MSNYTAFYSTADSFGTSSREITPGATDIVPVPKAVVLGAAGTITVVPADNADGDTVTFTDVPAGFVPPFRIRRVTAASATVYTVEG